jgi:hypothetical protein
VPSYLICRAVLGVGRPTRGKNIGCIPNRATVIVRLKTSLHGLVTFPAATAFSTSLCQCAWVAFTAARCVGRLCPTVGHARVLLLGVYIRKVIQLRCLQ